MSFYSDFAEYYEAVFPYRDEVYAFLKSHMPAGPRGFSTPAAVRDTTAAVWPRMGSRSWGLTSTRR